MKTILLSASILLATTVSALAQDKGKSTISIGFGLLPTEDILADALLDHPSIFPGKDKTMKARHGAISISYKYHISDKFALGASSTYNPNADVNGYLFPTPRNNNRKTLTTTAEGTFFWFQRRNFQVYSLMGAGLFVKKVYESSNYRYTWFGPTMQVSPAGIRLGEGAGVFVEVGYGYRGFLNGGFSWKL